MASNSRFQAISEEEIQNLITSKDSKSTQRTIKRSTATFRKFLIENKKSPDFENFDKRELNENLRLFFASIQKQGKNEDENGGIYKKNAYVNLRYGLSKFIKTELGWDIGEDPEFISSHEIFSAVCTKLKKTGYGETNHYPPIEPEDLHKLYRGEHFAFDIDTPVGLF